MKIFQKLHIFHFSGANALSQRYSSTAPLFHIVQPSARSSPVPTCAQTITSAYMLPAGRRAAQPNEVYGLLVLSRNEMSLNSFNSIQGSATDEIKYSWRKGKWQARKCVRLDRPKAKLKHSLAWWECRGRNGMNILLYSSPIIACIDLTAFIKEKKCLTKLARKTI